MHHPRSLADSLRRVGLYDLMHERMIDSAQFRRVGLLDLCHEAAGIDPRHANHSCRIRTNILAHLE